MIATIRTAWRRYQALTGARRELATLALALALGLLLLPFVIWGAGQVFLGTYTRDPTGGTGGGPFALWIDFLRGLASGSLGYWVAALGPYLILLSLRGSRAFLRK